MKIIVITLPKATARSRASRAARSPLVATAVGEAVLGIARDAFARKSEGMRDASGARWKRLQPATVAYGRDHPGVKRKRKHERPRGLLSGSQDALWGAVYRSALAKGKSGSDAARMAWGAVKARGGRTIIGEYGRAPHLIGVRTGKLRDSLRAERFRNDVRVYASAPYASKFFAVRPLLPPPDRWPSSWKRRLVEAAERGILEALRQ